jgi:hypothetical protein
MDCSGVAFFSRLHNYRSRREAAELRLILAGPGPSPGRADRRFRCVLTGSALLSTSLGMARRVGGLGGGGHRRR